MSLYTVLYVLLFFVILFLDCLMMLYGEGYFLDWYQIYQQVQIKKPWTLNYNSSNLSF